MTVETRTAVVCTLEKAKAELQALLQTTESEIECVAKAFEGLAGHTDTILNLAAAIVGCVENESVSSVPPKMQALGAAARRFIEDRLQSTTGILETVTTEVKLLRQLSQVTRSQAGVALDTKALSVLTNIEVARLGAVGAGFQYLAHELADFSKSVTADTQELAGHTDARRVAIEETRHVLAMEIPRLREEFARIGADLGNALSVVDSSLTQLSRTPIQFKTSVEDVAQQIAGVVAAVQAHDITRQQIDHVREAFGVICTRISTDSTSENDATQELARGYAGITIQIYQLRTIKGTVANWASQIRTCMGGILRISTSDMVGIGPVVQEQERELSSQLGHIELLERESQTYSERIQRTFGGLTNLMQLVSEHLQRAKSVRDHLQLLTFNSIIEASRLGTQAAAILSIATCIKGISAEWGRITDQAGQTMQDVLNLEKQTSQVMGTFSNASDERLHDAQAQTREGVDSLRAAAAFASRGGEDMNVATERMKAKTTEVGNSVDVLETCFGRIDAVLGDIEAVRHQMETECPGVTEKYDAADVELLFSARYTTELERTVLRAALSGAALPAGEVVLAGNSVELF